jgi:hypothetical protein
VLSFQPGNALILAILVSLAEVGLAWLLMPSLTTLPMAGIAAIVLLIIALLLGFLGRWLAKRPPPEQPETVQQVEKDIGAERLRAIYTLISILTATLNYKRVIDSALDLSLSALNSDPEAQPDDRLIGAVVMFSKEETLEVASARRFTPADLSLVLPGAEGAFARAIEDGNPVLVTKVAEDPELNRIVALRVCSQVCCFPLRSGLASTVCWSSVIPMPVISHPTGGRSWTSSASRR